ncbi:MAG: hypothetical protein A3A86_00405 [Elusimicrobia bacterium RIFCSPLOWO2_01_FULL_60_11]|nr:MAG: hypothetical protein A3A86_00405 [Elusimicrobia bacterium RIFCSPLOWO2_01_FULL_60_11]
MSKKTMKGWAVLGAAVLAGVFLCSPLRAEHGGGMMGHGDHEKKMDKMKEKLDLTPDQQAKMKAINESFMAEMKALHEKHKADMKAILTSEQQAKMEKMMEKREEHMEKRMEMRKDKMEEHKQ